MLLALKDGENKCSSRTDNDVNDGDEDVNEVNEVICIFD